MPIPPATLETTAAAPETLTPAEALAAAEAMRARILAEAPETEARNFHSQGLQDEFVAAGFYHLLRPRRYGGYEFSLPDFMRVMREVARADLSTGWCLTLASGHNLQIASWFSKDVQDRVFAGPYLAAPMTAAPSGMLERAAAGGWSLTGKAPYSSGGPYATHFVGHGMHPDRPGAMSTFIVDRAQWTTLDDWGTTLGLKGSGSHTLAFEGAHLPDDAVLVDARQIDMHVEDGTPGLELHGNPMYGSRAVGFFSTELANLMIGGVKAAFDEYEEAMATRRTVRPPIVPRTESVHYQTWYGRSAARIAAAEAVADRAAEHFMLVCERAASGGEPFTARDDTYINMIAREALIMAWDVLQDSLFMSVGTSAVTAGQRFERVWRDTSMAWGHLNTILRDWMAVDYAQSTFNTGAK